MQPLCFRLRLTSLLLGLCVLLASVGVPLSGRACRLSDEPAGCAPSSTAAPDCCAPETSPAAASSAEKAASVGCCVAKATFAHVAPTATGPVFSYQLPACPAILPSALAWVPAPPVGQLRGAPCCYSGTDSSPPRRLVGWALLRTLHQLRN